MKGDLTAFQKAKLLQIIWIQESGARNQEKKGVSDKAPAVTPCAFAPCDLRIQGKGEEHVF